MKQIVLVFCLFLFFKSNSQVIIKFNSEPSSSKAGIFSKSELIKESILPIEARDNKPQFRDGMYKIGYGTKVDIYPTRRSSKEIIDNYFLYRFQITIKNASSLKLTFDTLHLSKNSSLYIYNAVKTVITGPISSKENISGDRLWSSNTFPGESVILELKVPKQEDNQNSIHISSIAVSGRSEHTSNSLDSIAFGNFNFSSPCNINVLCSQGNAWANERKAICLIETNNSEYGTGSLVTNTCYNNKPYILTAWHNTYGRQPNNWTYIFGWWSSQCTPNTYNQQAWLFNGASLKATYEPTDVSLLELYQTPPESSDITYLGWSRSTAIPASSVGIHHPKGDQMKISFDNKAASIGNIKAFTNTAWRVVWDAGIVEGGSSGSPLFDTNKRVIGQMFSNTQPTYPPCNTQTGGSNYGRFDLSWDGGGTNSTRLSNWLDPGNTGALTTNTTAVSALSSYYLSVSGVSEICSSTSVSLNGVPSSTAVQWSAGGYVSVSGTGTQATITPINGAHGYVTISATVSALNCHANNPASIVMHVGSPYVGYSIEAYPNEEPSCYEPWGIYEMRAILSTGEGAVHGYEWGYRLQGTPGQVIYPYNNSYYVFIPEQAGTYEIFVRPYNECGSGLLESVKVVTVNNACGGGWGKSFFAAFPNPAKDEISVLITQEGKVKAQQNGPFQSELIEFMTGRVVKRWTLMNGQKSYRLNISDVKTGKYYLRMRQGEFRVGTQVIVEK